MNNLISKIVGVCLGLSLATGVAVGVGAGNQEVKEAKATDEVFYTLTPASGTNNSYTGNCDVAISGVTWNIEGNSQQLPWRLGGKSLSKVDRAVTSKTTIGSTITKVELTVGSASSITVHSLKMIVASNADFSNTIDTVTKTFSANSTITFNPTSGNEWVNNSYYKFVFNVSVSGTSNKFVEFSEAKFYHASGTPTVSVTGVSVSPETASIKVGKTVELSATVSPENASNKAVVWTSNDENVATVNSNGVVTGVSAGTATITATTSDGGYTDTCFITVEALEELTVSQALAIIDNLSSGDETEDQYIVTGYVSKIETAYSSTYHNISFWLSDSRNTSEDLQAYRTSCTEELSASIVVGAKLKVTGNLMNYNGTKSELTNGKNVVILETAPLGMELIIEPDYLGLTADGVTSLTTFNGTDGTQYKGAPSSATNSFKLSNPTSGGKNLFAPTKKVILMGKSGAYFYNSTPYQKKIARFELYSPLGASQSVQVAVGFATENDGPITQSITTNVKTLSTLDSVYDYSVSGMLDADYRYFRLEVRSAHNAQFQLKITFAEDDQQAVNLNSISISHADLDNGILPIPVGSSRTLTVAFDPSDASDQTLTWSTSNDSVATVADGVVTVLKTATINSDAIITATPTDTHASAQSITVKAIEPEVATVDMKYGLNNSQENRVIFVAGDSLVWPSGAIKVTLSDDSYFFDTDTKFDSSKVVWYYNNSENNGTDVEIQDLSTFVFATSMKRMRLSYDGVLASRAYITVNEPYSASDFANAFLEQLSTGDSAVCDADGNTDIETLQIAWALLALDYQKLSASDKEQFSGGTANPSGDSIAKTLALYDYIAGKYGIQLESDDLDNYNFMSRTISPSSNIIRPITIANNTAAIYALVAISMVTMTVVGAYFFLRKKKEVK